MSKAQGLCWTPRPPQERPHGQELAHHQNVNKKSPVSLSTVYCVKQVSPPWCICRKGSVFLRAQSFLFQSYLNFLRSASRWKAAQTKSLINRKKRGGGDRAAGIVETWVRKQPSELPFEGGKKKKPCLSALCLLLISFPSGLCALYKRSFLWGAAGRRGGAPGRGGGGRCASLRNTNLWGD